MGRCLEVVPHKNVAADSDDPHVPDRKYLGLAKLLGFEKMELFFSKSSGRRLVPICALSLSPMTCAEQRLWEVFLHERYDWRGFSEYSVMRIPLPVLRVLEAFQRISAFSNYEILLNVKHLEHMLCATREDHHEFESYGGGLQRPVRYMLARWCPPENKLLSVAELITLVRREIVEEGPLIRRLGSMVRTAALNACNVIEGTTQKIAPRT